MPFMEGHTITHLGHLLRFFAGHTIAFDSEPTPKTDCRGADHVAQLSMRRILEKQVNLPGFGKAGIGGP
jgi:hypothetical protein